jgi:hypothetical protein
MQDITLDWGVRKSGSGGGAPIIDPDTNPEDVVLA